MKSEDYVKVVYESNPIGEEKIILRLTTFDIEKIKEDERLSKVPETKEIVVASVDKFKLLEPDFRFILEQKLNSIVCQRYEQQILEMKNEIELLRSIKIVPKWYGGDSNE